MSQNSTSQSDSPSKTSLTDEDAPGGDMHEGWRDWPTFSELHRRFQFGYQKSGLMIVVANDAIPSHIRPVFWRLRDYFVQSVSGGSIWLAPRPPVVDECSLKFPGENV